ncbi:hypothetical protein [Micromonospora sp. NBC_01796]|uniref:hypothetical protein n=1 Tax=Micromonospora sp. NBC_01796 TaxID=2975987 RepID=UPI002DD9D053|nr:hypothetical protein [Micromonospora sp. NBC_01796]WSA88736.1 hypothetical protein OIE47_14655 [Micromonospora sp. NBC_01796]
MPGWLIILAGWTSLVFGGLGLWRGVTLLLRGDTKARDSTGTDAWLVLVEGGGQFLLGAALLLGGGWVHLIWPAVLLMAIGSVQWIRSWPWFSRSKKRSLDG